MIDTRGPVTVIPYDASGRALAPLTVEHPAEGAVSLWDTARFALPPGVRAFALLAPDGTLARIGVVPPESLTDDADTTALAVDAVGAYAATGHADGTIRLWDLATSEPLWSRTPVDGAVSGLAFVEAGGWVVGWAEGSSLVVFDRVEGELRSRMDGLPPMGFTVAISPDGEEAAITGPTVTRVALRDGGTFAALDLARAGAVADVAAGEPEDDAAEGEGTPGAGDGGVAWVAYTRDKNTIVGVRIEPEGADEVAFWDRASGGRVASLELPGAVAACDLSPDGGLIALALESEGASDGEGATGAGASEGRARVVFVDVTTRTVAREVDVPGAVADLRFAPDGASVVLCDLAAHVSRLVVATGEVQSVVAAVGERYVVPTDADIVPEEEESQPMMVTHDPSGRLRITGLDTRGPLGPVGRTLTAAGRYAICDDAADNNWVTVLDLARGSVVATLAHPGNIQEIWTSPDGARLVVRAAGRVYVWRIPAVPAAR